MTLAASTGSRFSASSSHSNTFAGRVSGGFAGRGSSGGRVSARGMGVRLSQAIVSDAPLLRRLSPSRCGIRPRLRGHVSRAPSVAEETDYGLHLVLGHQHRCVPDTRDFHDARTGPASRHFGGASPRRAGPIGRRAAPASGIGCDPRAARGRAAPPWSGRERRCRVVGETPAAVGTLPDVGADDAVPLRIVERAERRGDRAHVLRDFIVRRERRIGAEIAADPLHRSRFDGAVRRR